MGPNNSAHYPLVECFSPFTGQEEEEDDEVEEGEYTHGNNKNLSVYIYIKFIHKCICVEGTTLTAPREPRVPQRNRDSVYLEISCGTDISIPQPIHPEEVLLLLPGQSVQWLD